MYYLQYGKFHSSTKTHAQIKRVVRRARGYNLQRMANGDMEVRRVMANGSLRTVPKPSHRSDVTKQAHESTGHWGVRRTAHLLLANYWWQGVMRDVTLYVRNCDLCGRANAVFNSESPTLQPLPICGLFYRWGVDLAGPLKLTNSGNLYVMICVEHYSKTLVLIPLPNKESLTTAAAFQQAVLGHFGACAEVVTDGGMEWQGAFQALLARCFIDHRVTSAYHPAANGLAERCVKVVKKCLRRYVQDDATLKTWDEYLPFISLGYNCSKQTSTGFAPYHILYAREPFVPAAVSSNFDTPLDIPDKVPNKESESNAAVDKLITHLRERAAFVRRAMPTVANHLRIAQHRDKLRYAMVRSGAYLPALRKFSPGDYVYLRQRRDHTLELGAQQYILRVLEVRQDGTLLLQGRCGCTQVHNATNLAPCHMPNIDGTILPELTLYQKYKACEVCNNFDDEAKMVCCDVCNSGWHIYCLDPPLQRVPAGTFVCPNCSRAGITVKEVDAAKQARGSKSRQATAFKLMFGPKGRKQEIEHLASYDGRLVTKTIGKRGSGLRTLWGIVAFRGVGQTPPFLVVYDDKSQSLVTMAELQSSFKLMPAGSKKPASDQPPATCASAHHGIPHPAHRTTMPEPARAL